MKRLLFLVNIGCIIGLILAYASPYVAPQTWYVPQLFGLFYSYFLLANAIFFAFWLLFRKSYAKYSFLIIAIGFGFIPRVYKWSGKPLKSKEGTIKSMTYNVKKFGTDAQGKTINPSSLFEFIQQQDAAIACFQEYSHTRYQKYGSKILDKQYPHIYYNGEMATFSKYPIISKCPIAFDKMHYAAGIVTDIVIKNDTLRVINVHLESNQLSAVNKQDLENLVSLKRDFSKLRSVGRKLKKASLCRTQQTEKLATLIKNSSYPVVLCGDFNDTPLSYSYQRIKNLLNDSFIEVGENTGRTFSEGSIKVRIDYIFSQFSFYEHKVHQVPHSDHKPVTVWLKMNLE